MKINKIMMKDLESFREIAMFSRIYKEDFERHKVNEKRLRNLIRYGYLQKQKVIVHGKSMFSYILTDRSKKIVQAKFGMSSYGSSALAAPHDFKLKEVFKKIEYKEFYTQSDLRRIYADSMTDGRGCTDAGYIDSDGILTVVEIITDNYKRVDIVKKREFAKSIGAIYREFRIR